MSGLAVRGARQRILVAGIGNIFLGDDGFGVEVARRLRDEALGEGVEIADFGIRGIHLAYELASGLYDAAILIDAVPGGEEPGTLYVIDPDAGPDRLEPAAADAHSLTPAAVLGFVEQLGGGPGRLLIVGCEPSSVDESMELSPTVAASVDGAVQLVRDLVARMMEVTPCV
jgi:hydrogenase maturation protease